MTVSNIKWDVDIDDALEKLSEMSYEDAAAVLGFSARDYANMSTQEREGFAYDLWNGSPSSMWEFMELPAEVEVPDEVLNDYEEMGDEAITDWLSDEYGFCVENYDLSEDLEKCSPEFEKY